jgi:hypothetical protein
MQQAVEMIWMKPDQPYRIGGSGNDDLIAGFQGPSVHPVNLKLCGLVPLFLKAEADFRPV